MTERQAPADPNVVWHESGVTRDDRWHDLGLHGAVVWFTGLSGSGKSTVAIAVERFLLEQRQPSVLLDGDNLRHGLNADLGFSEADRTENIRRVGEVSLLFAETGVVALVPLISPYRASRNSVRHLIERNGLRFIEVFVNTPIEECERRDVKGLYAKARAGDIKGFTGIDDPYEEPVSPELTLLPADGHAATQAAMVIDLLGST